MSRALLIMRHAESGWGGASDFERTLTEQGQHDAVRIGGWLKQEGLLPDWIVASPAQRTKETLLAVCGALGVDERQIQWEPRIYEAEVNTLLEVLEGAPEHSERILMVGHNPGVAGLVQHLTGRGGDGFSPATVASLQVKVLESGEATLEQLVQPYRL